MSTLAPTLQTFFTQRLLGERQASPHTVAAYRDTFRLLPAFTTARLGKTLRGRDAGYPAPPAQIRTCALTHTAPTSGSDRGPLDRRIRSAAWYTELPT